MVAAQRTGAFKPEEHFRNLKGQQYLEVKWRVVWFREEHPDGYIRTDLVEHEATGGLAVFKAQAGFTIADGREVYATGYGSETRKDFADYLEKSETKAIGRALAMLGYGTAQAIELDEGEREIVDAPASGRTSARRTLSAVPPAKTEPAAQETAPTAPTKPEPRDTPESRALRQELAEWYERYPDRKAQVDAYLAENGWDRLGNAALVGEVNKMRQRAADDEAQRQDAAQEAAATDMSASERLAGALEVARATVTTLRGKKGGPNAGDYEGIRVLLREIQACAPLPDDVDPKAIPPRELLNALRARILVAESDKTPDEARQAIQEADDNIPF